VLDRRGRLLVAALGFAGCSMPSRHPALQALRTWLDSWSGIGRIAVGMARQGYTPMVSNRPAQSPVHTHKEPNMKTKRTINLSEALLFALLTVISLKPIAAGAVEMCPRDAVQVGPTCLDKYEASLWKIADAESATIRKIRAGMVTLAELTAAGAVQLGRNSGDLAANGCSDTGNGCVDVYAVSIPGVEPARFTTWFQAVATARNSFKRLPSNAEWQAGALGTPDPGANPGAQDCNTLGSGPDLTGARTNCISDAGAFDIVGNVSEWVAEWVPLSTHPCGTWGNFSDDIQCLVGADTTSGPGALIRGGDFNQGAGAGVFAVFGDARPFDRLPSIGFRAAR
jgi:sulfatase-modifying factor enzyme 1